MKGNKGLMLVVGVAAVAWWLWPSQAPEAALADHVEEICDIARSNLDSPTDGVEDLFKYEARNAPEMLQLFGELLVSVERIEDDAEHDERAREAAAVLHGVLGDCAEDLEAFGEAVEADPEARALMQRGTERLGRTMFILLGADGAGDFGGLLEAVGAP